MIAYRRFLANGLVAWGIVNLFLLFFGLSMTDYDFRDIVTKPDNVPIVGLIVLVGFFTWLGLRRAVINDSRMAQGLPEPRGARAREDADLARPGLHRADLHGRADDLPGRLGDRAAGAAGAAGELDGRPPTRRRPPGTSSASRRCSSTSTPGWPASSCRA